MNGSDLKQKLASWKLPAISESTRARAEWHALTAFRNRTQEPGSAATPATTPYLPWLILSGLGSAVVLFLLSLLWWPPNETSVLQNPAPLLSELEQFFQGRLAAVVQQNGEVDLRLADVPVERPPDQRVAVRLEWPGETIEILTYSGVPVCVDSPEGTLCLTPFITGSGNVLLLGDTGLLENQPGLHTEAHLL
jgi:hypothetical protein